DDAFVNSSLHLIPDRKKEGTSREHGDYKRHVTIAAPKQKCGGPCQDHRQNLKNSYHSLFAFQFLFCNFAKRLRTRLSSPKESHDEIQRQTNNNRKRNNCHDKRNQSQNEIQRKIKTTAECLPKTVEESGRACRKHGWGLKA